MINLFPRLAMRNKKFMTFSTMAGCYHCTKQFLPTEIIEWVDQGQTAICPHCKVDAVILNGAESNITLEKLENANKYWFNNLNTKDQNSQP